MRQYLDLMERVLEEGVEKRDRTGTGTRSIFGHQMRFDLGCGFPLVTTKKLHVKSVIYELLWFLRGDTNVRNISTITASRSGTNGLTPTAISVRSMAVNGARGRRLTGATLIRSRRHSTPSGAIRICDASWLQPGYPAELPQMALAPCHCLFQFYVADGKLSCQLYQRSADVFLGVPFNIASYALLTMAVAHVSGLKPGTFVHSFGDAHLYLNHLDQARLQLTRQPRPLPTLTINPAAKDLFALAYEDFALEGYDPHPHIKAAVAV